jgi:hypothetical protein
MKRTPYVSFVTYGRNDGYTANYVRRVSRATTLLARQLERAKLDAEILIAEWNPAPDRPLLLEVLDVPKALQYVSIRGVIVDPAYHKQFAGWQERGVQGGEAVNAGIRRSRGRYVTFKASDTFYTPHVIAMLARRDLDPDTVYRIDRHDVLIADESIWDLGDDDLIAKLQSLPSESHAYIQQSPHWELRDLHTNACGDFTLMSSAHWDLVRGHAKDDTVLSLDIDSLVLHAAVANGVRECRWPDSCRVYKPIHGNLHVVRVQQIWKPWQRRLDKILSEKISETAAHRVRTWLDYPRRKVRGVNSVVGPSIERNFVQPASRWARGQRMVPTQPETWGLADANLEERTLCRAGWEAT